MTTKLQVKGTHTMRLFSRTIFGRLALTATALLLIAGGLFTSTSPAMAAGSAGRANGDIPDSATYLRYAVPNYHIEYIEGWGRQSSGQTVTFSDKDSQEQVTLLATPHGSFDAYVRGQVAGLQHAGAKHILGPKAVTLPGGHAWYLQYTIPSAPDQVTGKVVSLLTDRYYISGAHQVAVLTLGSPVGDDNVDAFRRIAHSFGWR